MSRMHCLIFDDERVAKSPGPAGAAGEDFPCTGISPLLSTFLLFYFPWRSESDGSISSMTL